MFSIKGSRSLASMLGTGKGSLYTTMVAYSYILTKGDYDGDIVTCIWQPSIVEPFSNADTKHMKVPANLQDHFYIKNETVEKFLQRVPPSHPTMTQIQELQTVLMTPLSNVYAVGSYSTMHDNAIYSLGYSHPSTTLLAWM